MSSYAASGSFSLSSLKVSLVAAVAVACPRFSLYSHLMCCFGSSAKGFTLRAAMITADRKFGSGNHSSEDFQTCGRTIKTGLIAVGEDANALAHLGSVPSPAR